MRTIFRLLSGFRGPQLSSRGSGAKRFRVGNLVVMNMASQGFQKATNNKYPLLTYEKESKWKGSFCFIQSADTQFGLIDSWNGIPESEQKWDKEIALTRKAIAAANRLSPKPRFFVVCGDLVNAIPGEKYNDAQVQDFKEVFKDLDPSIPLVCVCGNHDIGNTPTQEAVRKYRSDFGDDFFSFWVGGRYRFDCSRHLL